MKKKIDKTNTGNDFVVNKQAAAFPLVTGFGFWPHLLCGSSNANAAGASVNLISRYIRMILAVRYPRLRCSHLKAAGHI